MHIEAQPERKCDRRALRSQRLLRRALAEEA